MAATQQPMKIEREERAPLRIIAGPARSSITPASRLALVAIDRHPDLLRGRGIDWGSGTGVLAIAAATYPAVDLVLGLEIDRDEIARARANAEINGVADKVRFVRADAFEPLDHDDMLEELLGATRFVIANPPFRPEGDGLGWRREVLRGARPFLAPGADVLLQVSRQYGARIQRLAADAGDYEYEGLLESSAWVTFDQDRADLRAALDLFAIEEARSGEPFPFLHPFEEREIGAIEARRLRDETGASPRSQWQMHRFAHTV